MQSVMALTVVSCITGAAGINLSACGNKIKIVNDNDANAFVKAILQVANESVKTPETYYAYYYWGNIIKKIQYLFQDSKI